MGVPEVKNANARRIKRISVYCLSENIEIILFLHTAMLVSVDQPVFSFSRAGSSRTILQRHV